jgi:hypothetical protein
MDSEYIITQSGSFISTDELYHHGIRGMKWGVRRYQNADGSLTDKGRKRYLNDDGSLNKKGEKYYAKETERLKAERKTLRAQKSATRKLSKLEEMRKKNAELDEEVNGKKTKEEDKTSSGESASTSKSEKSSDMSSMSTADLKAYSSRMQVEDNFKQLLEKRGYTVSLDEKTDIDRRIDQLSKEKTLRQLEKEVDKMNRGKTDTERKIEELTQKRDITKLEKEIRDNTPKKESKLSKFLNSQAGSALTTQLIKSGENVLITRLKEKAGNDSDNTSKAVKETVDKVTKTLGKEAEKVSKSMDKQAEKQAKREAKDAEKQARKESKAAEKQSRNKSESTKVYEGTVEGEGTSRSSIKNGGRKGPTYDVKDYTETYSSTPVTDLSTTSRSRGYDYIERIKTDYGYRYIYELPSGS